MKRAMSLACLLLALAVRAAAEIPLPEHPRPDFERPAWVNLNGPWQFRFDGADEGLAQSWPEGDPGFPLTIMVPFPWGSPLSGVPDTAKIAWYNRSIEVPSEWKGRRVFLVVGASDWHTTAWLDGKKLGEHKGGYVPFEFELKPHVRPGGQRLTIRVDDADRAFKLEGKQGYGNARGIWQTPYLEARGAAALASLHFTPDVAAKAVKVEARLLDPAPRDLSLRLAFKTGGLAAVEQRIPAGSKEARFDVKVGEPRQWSLRDPFLYEVEASVEGAGAPPDVVRTYFGMRTVSVVSLPGTDHRYVALNGEPVYLQLALDQAYHPEGFYTFPNDAFVRDEVLRARQIGLNGLREHVKLELPRKLYWADRLGVLIMADVPNAWGEPTPEMRQEIEYTLRAMIARDYNHPSIFSWIPFNETWGLTHKLPKKKEQQREEEEYRPETQKWVASVYRLAKSLDATRLVEDNSVCCKRGHTETDLNSWHAYLPGWAWDEELATASKGTFPGSTWNFEPGYKQDRQPNINSEFGNVWGYEGSTGDVDWSWDYHRAVNSFRRHPKVAGWLYTEHHDVINEWNGYWRFDRSDKHTGIEELAPGMSLRDLHSPLYVAVGAPAELSRAVKAGETVEVPLWASFLTGESHGDSLVLEAKLRGWNALGREQAGFATRVSVPYRPWMSEALPPLSVPMPKEPGVAVLTVELSHPSGAVLQRNFTTFVVEGARAEEATLADGRRARLLSVDPKQFSSAAWSLKQWNVLDGLKVNGAGSGHFEYRVPWPKGLALADVAGAAFVVEASAKRLNGKDRDDAGAMSGDYMLGKGTHDPSRNPNSYPMTDEEPFPSAVTVTVNGLVAGRHELADDPADHRGILSWHSQLKDKKLREAGSYGYLLETPIPPEALARAASSGTLELRLEVDEALPGGLAIYGARFGRYPLDPTVVLVRREAAGQRP